MGEAVVAFTTRFRDFNAFTYSMKPGRVVILLAGRHAGKKAIIVRQHDEGKKVSHLFH